MHFSMKKLMTVSYEIFYIGLMFTAKITLKITNFFENVISDGPIYTIFFFCLKILGFADLKIAFQGFLNYAFKDAAAASHGGGGSGIDGSGGGVDVVVVVVVLLPTLSLPPSSPEKVNG